MNTLTNVHIELTYGCNRKCLFCFKQVRTKTDYTHMTLDTAKQIINKLRVFNYPLRIKFSLRGEPTLNPNYLEIIRLFREGLPESVLVLITNGDGLTPYDVHNIFENGINFILMDCYNNTLDKRKEEYKPFFNIIDYYTDSFDLYKDYPVTIKQLVLVDDLSNHCDDPLRVLHNHAGNIDFDKVKLKPLKKSLHLSCIRPSRDLAIQFNGDIVLCCDDASSETILGNIKTIPDLNEFWNNDVTLNQIREQLTKGNREMIQPCNRCDYNGS